MKILLGIIAPFLPFFLLGCNTKSRNYQFDRVYDGDTIFFKGGKRGRLFGIDTPELKRGPNNTTGIERTIAVLSKKYLQQLMKGKEIRFDVITQDKYGRDVIKLFAGNIDVGKRLVEKGYARVAYISNSEKSLYFTKDENYLNDLLWLQRKAYINNEVIWKNKSAFKKVFPKSK